jgi:hypothetical protein
MSLRELARQLEMSSPGVGFSVERGETIARENVVAINRIRFCYSMIPEK